MIQKIHHNQIEDGLLRTESLQHIGSFFRLVARINQGEAIHWFDMDVFASNWSGGSMPNHSVIIEGTLIARSLRCVGRHYVAMATFVALYRTTCIVSDLAPFQDSILIAIDHLVSDLAEKGRALVDKDCVEEASSSSEVLITRLRISRSV